MGGHRGVKVKQDGFVPTFNDNTTVETANVMVAIHHMKLLMQDIYIKRKKRKKKKRISGKKKKLEILLFIK